MYAKVKDLPQSAQRLLKSLEFHKQDINVVAKETTCAQSMGREGARGLFATLNLDTGETTRHDGSFGGANMFNPNNVVDNLETTFPILPNILVFKGETGGFGTSCSIYVNPITFNGTLLPKGMTLTDRQAAILMPFRALKAGPYRQEELARLQATQEEISALIALGALKEAKNGARTITTEGKNALTGMRSPCGLVY